MRRLLLAGATALAIGAGAFEFYVKPTVLEQAPALVDEALATTVNGTVRYDKLDIDWAGNAHVKNATVTDAKGLTVARVPDIEVSWNLWRALEYAMGKRAALGVLDGITIEQPEVWLREEPDRSWNIAHLIRPQETQTEFSLRAKIMINRGLAHLEFLHDPTIDLTDVTCGMDLNDYPTVTGRAKFLYNNEPVTLTGNYTAADDFNAHVTAKRLPITLANYVLRDAAPEIALQAGEIHNTDLNVSADATGLRYDGTAELRDGALQYDRYKVTGAKADVRLATRRLSVADMQAQVNLMMIRRWICIWRRRARKWRRLPMCLFMGRSRPICTWEARWRHRWRKASRCCNGGAMARRRWKMFSPSLSIAERS